MFEAVILGGSDLITPVLLGGFKYGRGLEWNFRMLFRYVLKMSPSQIGVLFCALRGGGGNKEGRNNFCYHNAYFLVLRWESSFWEASLLIAHVCRTIKDAAFACTAVIQRHQSVWVCLYFTGNHWVVWVFLSWAIMPQSDPPFPFTRDSLAARCSGKHHRLCSTAQQGWTTRFLSSLINCAVM